MTSQAKIDWQAKLLEVIPLLVGIAITRRFNLHGWRAIVTYILAAGATRQLIEALEAETGQENLESRVAATPAYGNGRNDSDRASGPPILTLPVAGETYQVIHTTPGRLRVRVPGVKNTQYAQHLQRHLHSDDHFQLVRVNVNAFSVTIKYDTKEFTEIVIRSHLGKLITQATETFTEKVLPKV